jgi:hypothetical protein
MTMTTTNDSHPMWTDGDVMESMHAIHSVLGEWEQAGASEDVDIDSMEDIEERFTMALGNLFAHMESFRRRSRKRA